MASQNNSNSNFFILIIIESYFNKNKDMKTALKYRSRAQLMNVVQRGQRINSKNLADLKIECEKSLVSNFYYDKDYFFYLYYLNLIALFYSCIFYSLK